MNPDKLIKNLLDELNQQKISGHIITRTLSKDIVLAKIWNAPITENVIVHPFAVYLIKQGEEYIGGAIEYDNGLFAYIQPAYRRKQIACNALRSVVLPHLLQQKPVLRVHISRAVIGGERSFHIAKKLALSCGFILLQEDTSNCRLMMDASSLKERVFIKGVNEKLSGERKTALQKTMNYTATLLSLVQTELEYTCGISGYSEELNDMIKSLDKHKDKLNNAWFEK